MVAAIGCSTGPGNEAIARAHLAAVSVKASRNVSVQPPGSL